MNFKNKKQGIKNESSLEVKEVKKDLTIGELNFLNGITPNDGATVGEIIDLAINGSMDFSIKFLETCTKIVVNEGSKEDVIEFASKVNGVSPSILLVIDYREKTNFEEVFQNTIETLEPLDVIKFIHKNKELFKENGDINYFCFAGKLVLFLQKNIKKYGKMLEAFECYIFQPEYSEAEFNKKYAKYINTPKIKKYIKNNIIKVIRNQGV